MTSSKNNVRIFDSFLLACTFFCTGLYRHVPGSTLIDFAEKIDEDLMFLASLLLVRAVGYICGMLCGTLAFRCLLDEHHAAKLYFIFMLLMAITAFTVPLCNSFHALCAPFGAAGVGIAAVESGIHMQQEGSQQKFNLVLFQIFQIAHGAGSIAAPLISKLFVREKVGHVRLTKYSQLVISSGNAKDSSVQDPAVSILNIYRTLGAVMVGVAVLWLIRMCLPKAGPVSATGETAEKYEEVYRKGIFFFTCAFCYFASILLYGYTQILPVFSVEAYKKNPKEACDLLILFLFFAGLGKIASVFVAREVTTVLVFFTQVVVMVFCGGIIVFYLREEAAIIIAHAVVGFAAGPLCTCTLGWLAVSMGVNGLNLVPLILSTALAEMLGTVMLSAILWTMPHHLGDFLLGLSGVLTVLLAITSLVKCTFRKIQNLLLLNRLSLTTNIRWKPTKQPDPKHNNAVAVKSESETDFASIAERLSKIHERLVEENKAVTEILRRSDVSEKYSKDSSSSSRWSRSDDYPGTSSQSTGLLEGQPSSTDVHQHSRK